MENIKFVLAGSGCLIVLFGRRETLTRRNHSASIKLAFIQNIPINFQDVILLAASFLISIRQRGFQSFFSRTIEGARTNRLPNKYISNDKPNCRITNRRWCLKQSPCPAHPRYLASPEYGYVSLLVPFSLPFFPLRSPLQSCSINFRSF